MKAFLIALILLVSGYNDPLFKDNCKRSDTVIVISKTYYFDGREPQLLFERSQKDWYARLFNDGTKVVYKEAK